MSIFATHELCEASYKHRLRPVASSLIKYETLYFERKRGMDP